MMIEFPAQIGEGSPEVSIEYQPAQEGTPQTSPCPPGYACGTVQDGQTFTDLLLRHNVSWQALRDANPTLPTTRLAPGTRYCIPPVAYRRRCPSGTDSYVMGPLEDLTSLSELFGVEPGIFLSVNPQLAPSDFTAGRVICVP